MSSTTTLKLPPSLKARVVRLARTTGKSPHSLMVEALERQVEREERLHAFVEDAIAAGRKIDAGGEVYAADDVHAWLKRLASGRKASRPKPWRR